ncbi:MAG TPA: cytochrome c biogenesis protein CcsA [Acidiferrobacter sp.]|nr:cytochrome c biogenesis protein CcsA [Acidiferrobacter sp.]
MIQLILHVIAIVLYGLSGVYYWRGLKPGSEQDSRRRLAASLATLAVLLQAGLLVGDIDHNGHLTLGIGTILSLDAWAVAAIFLAASLRKPIASLGTFIMPSAAVAAIGQIFLPMQAQPNPAPVDPWLVTHVVVSILAYSLLSIAVAQSLVLWIQENRLRHKQSAQLMQAFPPMETMESLMFEMIRVGFALLTLTLISGLFFSDQLFGTPLSFTHHSILSFIAWFAFAILLIGRRQFGWRGRNAVRWTVVGFVFLVFAYLSAEFLLKYVFAS